MESWNHKKKNLIEEDANISKFRRRTNIIIFIFILLIISLALITAALITTLIRAHNDSPQPHVSPIEAFCSVSDKPLCFTTLNPVINKTTLIISNPNQIFALSLRASSKSLRRVIDSIPSNYNCTESLRRGSGRIRDASAGIRVDPFVEAMSDERRGDLVNRIAEAEDDVMSCLYNLDGAEAPAAAEEEEELRGVVVCLDAAVDFLLRFELALEIYEAGNGVDRRMISENLFGISLCGLQILFIFCLYYSLLFRTR